VSVYLLDVNVLIALAWPNHAHHLAVRHWFLDQGLKGWATCPMTQTAFVRISSNPSIIADAVRPEQAADLLKKLASGAGHQFWADDVSLTEAEFKFTGLLTGHRQVTDAYLLTLAIRKNGKLATLDRGVVELAKSKDHVFLIKT